MNTDTKESREKRKHAMERYNEITKRQFDPREPMRENTTIWTLLDCDLDQLIAKQMDVIDAIGLSTQQDKSVKRMLKMAVYDIRGTFKEGRGSLAISRRVLEQMHEDGLKEIGDVMDEIIEETQKKHELR